MMKKILFFAALLAIATPAMAIDFGAPIMLIDGKTPMRNEDKTILMLDAVVENALLASYQDEPSLPGTEKVKRFNLAKKIHDQRKDPALSAEDITLIKTLVAKAYTPLVVGRVWEIIDPAAKP